MNIKELVIRNRSRRRFYQNEVVSLETLRELVDLARLSPSGGNKQSLKYYISYEPTTNQAIFPCLSWAGYLKDWQGPKEGERPAAYIVVLHDEGISNSPGCDHGIAVQSMLLGAVERGLAGCIIGSVDKDRLSRVLNLEESYDVLLVVALGRAREEVEIEEIGPEGDIRYWRDREGVHHVPKRSLDNIIVK